MFDQQNTSWPIRLESRLLWWEWAWKRIGIEDCVVDFEVSSSKLDRCLTGKHFKCWWAWLRDPMPKKIEPGNAGTNSALGLFLRAQKFLPLASKFAFAIETSMQTSFFAVVVKSEFVICLQHRNIHIQDYTGKHGISRVHMIFHANFTDISRQLISVWFLWNMGHATRQIP